MIICKLLIVIIVLYHLLLWVKTKTLPKFFIQYYFHLSPIQNSEFKIPPFPLRHTLWQTFKVCQSFSGTFPPKSPKSQKSYKSYKSHQFTIQNSQFKIPPFPLRHIPSSKPSLALARTLTSLPVRLALPQIPKVPKVPKVLQVPPIQNSKFTIQNSPVPLAPYTSSKPSLALARTPTIARAARTPPIQNSKFRIHN